MKNYTSQVPADRSVLMIERLLVANGAMQVLKEYDGERLSAISFQKEINGKTMPFRIPANAEAVFNVMAAKRARALSDSAEDKLRDQAERTAWRIAHEWVQIQMAFIEMQQAEFMQLFMSHMLMPGKGGKMETFYEHLKGSKFRQLEWKEKP